MYAMRAISTVLALLYTLVMLGTCSADTLPQNGSPALVDAVQEDIPLGLSAPPATLNILQPHSGVSLALQEAADFFLASHPNTSIRIQTVGNRAEYQSVLHAKLLAGEQVDLFHIFGHNDLLSMQPYIQDAGDLTWAQDAYADTIVPMQQDGKIFGIPYSIEGVGLIANRDILNAAGIVPGELETLADFSEAFQELRSQIDSGDLAEDFPELAYVTEFPALDKAFLGEQLAGIALTDSFDTPQQAATSSYASFPRSEMLDEYVQLLARYTSSCRDWAGLNSTAQNRQVENGLASGRVAVIQQNINIWQRVALVNNELADHLVLLPIPSFDEDEDGFVRTSSPSYWVIGEDASDESARLAREFLTWLYQSDTGAAFLADRFGVISPYRGTAKSTDAALHNQLLSYIEYGGTRPSYHGEAPSGWSGQFYENLRAYLVDELTWKQMCEDNMLEWRKLRE